MAEFCEMSHFSKFLQFEIQTMFIRIKRDCRGGIKIRDRELLEWNIGVKMKSGTREKCLTQSKQYLCVV